MVSRFAIDRAPLGSTETTKREAFRRLAEKRTNAILERIRILGNLSNRSAYEYTDDDLRKIFSAIDEEIRIAKTRFRATEKREFRLG